MHILYVYVVKNVRMLQGFDSFLRTISMVKMLYGSIMILIWTEDGFLNGRKTEATLALVITGNKIELAMFGLSYFILFASFRLRRKSYHL